MIRQVTLKSNDDDDNNNNYDDNNNDDDDNDDDDDETEIYDDFVEEEDHLNHESWWDQLTQEARLDFPDEYADEFSGTDEYTEDPCHDDKTNGSNNDTMISSVVDDNDQHSTNFGTKKRSYFTASSYSIITPNKSKKKSSKINHVSANQTTMTQHFKHQFDREYNHVDTRDTPTKAYHTVYIPNPLERILQINEAFKLKDEKNKDLIFVIDSPFVRINGFRKAVGKVYRKLKDFFLYLNSTEERFIKHLREFKNDGDDEIYVKYEQEVQLYFKDIGDRVMNFKVPCKYYSYEGPNDVNRTHGFTFSIKPIYSFTEPMTQDHLYDDFIIPDDDVLREAEKISSMGIESKNKEKEKPIPMLDIFSGIGGMSMGFQEAGGYDLKWAVDKNANAAATFELNHRNTVVFDEDVKIFYEKVKKEFELFTKSREMSTSPYLQVLQEAKHIHFSPPCQGFCPINTSGGKNDLENKELTLFCIEIIKLFKTHGKLETISYENVLGLLNTKHRNYLNTFLMSLISLDMKVRLSVLDSSRYGDPQSRKRIFITACKLDYDINNFPEETCTEDSPVTTSDILEKLKNIDPTDGNGIVELKLSDGSTIYPKNHSTTGTNIKSNMTLLIADKPAHTILRKYDIQHYSKNRALSILELALLFSFPYSYKFGGTHRQKINGIGNAVPVKVAKAVAEAIKTMYA